MSVIRKKVFNYTHLQIKLSEMAVVFNLQSKTLAPHFTNEYFISTKYMWKFEKIHIPMERHG